MKSFDAQFDQTSLGLPTRSYFLQSSNTAYVEAYKNYMINIAVLLGADRVNATANADEVIAFETRLAEVNERNNNCFSTRPLKTHPLFFLRLQQVRTREEIYRSFI